MAKPLSVLLEEADSVINSRVSPLNKEAAREDDIFKLAEQVRSSGSTLHKEASEMVPEEEYSFKEKVAHAKAISDAFDLLPVIGGIAAFEKKARASGFSEEQIEQFIEDNSAKFGLSSL